MQDNVRQCMTIQDNVWQTMYDRMTRAGRMAKGAVQQNRQGRSCKVSECMAIYADVCQKITMYENA